MITLNKSTRGFTLIELLVVITIIGILATGAVSVYTSQIQKARDTTRINDIKALQSGVEQTYQDGQKYPDAGNFATSIAAYVPKIPKDPKSGETLANTSFEYMYNQGKDTNGIEGQIYEVSTAFEAQGNLTSKAADTMDKGNDANRLEVGVSMDTLATKVKGAIAGSVILGECITSDGADVVTCGTSTAPDANAM
ncbi:MAG: prepilin-type N-terminal cleavage/methylation domain-containing protein, partial [Candidatus Gracilibacteria bacterium]|nr:prepilin-type N-terminal cleavage/methylation domain-containing protein [Candidatus Gracilibacteria bacterium]